MLEATLLFSPCTLQLSSWLGARTLLTFLRGDTDIWRVSLSLTT